MFENITPEQREALKRRNQRVDGLLKTAIETQAEPRKAPLRRLHMVPNLRLSHGSPQRNIQVA